MSDAEELLDGDPIEVAVENARRKAVAVAGSSEVQTAWRAGPVTGRGDSASGVAESSSPAPPARSAAAFSPSVTVLGVDTVVVIDGAIYGKPADAGEARATLSRLSGRVHEVVSGLCVVEDGDVRTASATTRVRFRDLAPTTLDWYVGTGEWEERAGGYAIQARGAALVAGIEGDYLNVVGLPVAALLELLPGIVHGAS